MQLTGLLQKIPVECGLAKFSEKVGKFLDGNPLINKIVILANFVFRIAMMSTFMAALPFSIFPNFLLSMGASIFYRVTIERYCQYRFSILSCAAAGAYEISKPGLLSLISGTAFSSLAFFGTAFAFITPLAISATAIFITINQNVNAHYLKTHSNVKNSDSIGCPPVKLKSCCNNNRE